jgi:SAM-dependent methyltransferase
VQSFDRVADQYDATRGLPPEASARVSAGIASVLRALAQTPRLLEVGVGTGRIAVPLERDGVRLVGIDIAPQMLAQLRAKSPTLPVARAVAERLPFRRAAFDGALFVHVLHLVSDARDALAAALECVRPGGLLLLGLTDFATSQRQTVVRWVAELTAELAGVELPPADWNRSTRAAFRAAAEAVGSPVTALSLASWKEDRTGRQLLDGLRGRLYSSSWRIPEDVMPELLRRLTPRVEEFFGGLDRSVSSEATFSLETFAVGGAEGAIRTSRGNAESEDPR